MALRRTREEREALRAEIERQDREHAARLAAISAQARRPVLFCQQCEAKLKSDAKSLAYPIGRGTGALLAAVAGIVLLGQAVITAAQKTWEQASPLVRDSATSP